METEKRRALVEMSRLLGEPERDLVIIGEGNTSCRVDEETFLVKASGQGMQTIDESGFVHVRFEPLLDLLDLEVDAAQAQQIINAAKVDAHQTARPSVEVTFHAVLLHECGAQWIAHTHPTPINQIMCSPRTEEFAAHRLFPDDVVLCGPRSMYVPYVDPGLPLAREIRTRARGFRDEFGEPPRVILMQNHGLIALGQTAADAVNTTLMCVKAARIFIGACALGGPNFLSTADVVHIYRRPDEIYRRKLFEEGRKKKTGGS